MKAIVIHHSLNTPGGEATLAIETIRSLHELGYNVELVTVQKPNLERIAKDLFQMQPMNSFLMPCQQAELSAHNVW